MSQGNGLSINEKLDKLLSWQHGAGEVEKIAPSTRPREAQGKGAMMFSVIFFSDVNQTLDHKYQLVFEVATFADQHGFKAVWLPERHFHPFGGIYPSPATLAAALAVKTQNIRLRSGSVVLPLHHPIEVVETWAMIDNLSGGRVDLGFASGWNPNDFILSPGTYGNLKQVWHERIPLVQKLWRGERLAFENGKGETVEIQVYPKPIQPELDIWFVISKSDESFKYAGSQGYNVLTMLQGIDLDELGKKIHLYRTARKENGFDPEAGVVTLMLHTLVNKDLKLVEEAVREPFLAYIKSALSGHIQVLSKDQRPSEAELNKIVDYSYERYFKTGALFGSIKETEAVVEKAQAVGVNEIACLMDFGVDYGVVIDSLAYLEALKDKAMRRG
jgi:natural product biosynthesis luciferase-like monooxygenase protein